MKLPARHLFLDLEDTVITPVMQGWWMTECINVAKVKTIIAGWKPDYIHLFSFAIWNADELEKFKLGTLPMLEDRFGIRLSNMWNVDDQIIPMCCKEMGIELSTVDFQEMSNFWSKHQAFRLCMRQHFKNTHTHSVDTEVMLLDDAVFNESFHWPDLRLKGQIINIDHPAEF